MIVIAYPILASLKLFTCFRKNFYNNYKFLCKITSYFRVNNYVFTNCLLYKSKNLVLSFAHN